MQYAKAHLSHMITEPAIRVIAAAVSLSAICAALRLRIEYFPVHNVDTAFWITKLTLRSSYYDMLLTWGLAIGCIISLVFTLRLKRVQNSIVSAYLVFSVLSVVFACINVPAVSYIGSPLTMQWIYYADLLQSVTGQSAIRHVVDSDFLLMLGLCLAALPVIYWIAIGFLKSIHKRKALPLAAIAAGMLLFSYFVQYPGFSGWDRAQSGWDRAHLANPLFEFVFAMLAGPEILEPEALPNERVLPAADFSRATIPQALAEASIQNVVIIVLESIGADYVAGSGPAEAANWTPNIAKYRDSTLSFRNIYAHVPLTIRSLFALLTSRYPPLVGGVNPEDSSGSLSNFLQRKGYRTGFFMSSDVVFQSSRAFLRKIAFEQIDDFTSIPCKIANYVGNWAEWPHQDSVPDRCTAQRLINWLRRADERPFFAVLWTNNSHWPYLPEKSVRQPDLKTYLDALRSDSATVGKNAYINALRSSDAAVGEILGYLRDQDLLHSTLVVILSDHGEAFGEHGLKIHGNSIYEEEVHIPLLLINQHISRFSTVETLGGIIDVGPTIEHLLSLKPDYMLDGRSLFDPNRSDKVFLFAPSLEMVVGYRTGQTKYMYNAVRNRAEVYNLANDPAERRNISDPSSASAIRAQIPWIKSARDKPF